MAKQKPYREDGALTRRLMLDNVTRCLDENVLNDNHSQRAIALFSFYNNPPGSGYQYHWNPLWVMSTDFNKAYRELEDLLHEKIDAAKQTPAKNKRRIRAVELTIELWEKGHHFDQETGEVVIVPVPVPRKMTPLQRKLQKDSINATWKNGSRNS